MWFFRRKRRDAPENGTHESYGYYHPDNADPSLHLRDAVHPWARPRADDDERNFDTAHQADQPREQHKPRRSRTRQILRFGFAFTAFSIVLASTWLGAMMFYYTLKFPDPFAVRRDGKAPVIRILARDGSMLAERGAAHPYMPIDMLPRHVIDAVVATEDRRFFSHWGVDPFGLTRAMFANMRAGRFKQGGSTLTQQLAKNLFLSHERTLMRKVDELALAMWLEYRLDKREILELYLNRVYFGAGAYGIEAASQRYYGKSARAMNVAEAALVAGLLKAPSRYAPTANPGAGRARGRSVLRKMFAAGVITRHQLQNSLKQSVRFAKKKTSIARRGNGYAVDYILDRLPRLLDTSHAEIMVETTIDPVLQRSAHSVISEQFKKRGAKLRASQAALVTMDRDGGIRALVGGVDYAKSQYNRATHAHRQPGSTFKPFVYLSALEAGYAPETITYDLPVSIKGWKPRNANGRYKGTITVREALAKSINTVAVRLALDVGLDKVASTSRRLGIEAKLRADPSLALGTSEVPLLEMVGAYNVFANGGRASQPHIIHRIRTSGGRVLYARPAQSNEQRIDPKHVGAMNDMLNAALIVGTGRKAALAEHPAAGKTGTSQEFRDAWFIGYTAHMTAGIWVGNDKGTPMRKVTGGSLPAEIWRTVMTTAHRDKTALPLPYTARVGTRLSNGPVAMRNGRALRNKTKRQASTQKPKVQVVNRKPVATPPLPARRPQNQYPVARIPENFVTKRSPKRAPTVTAKRRPTNQPVRQVKRAAPTALDGFDVRDIKRRLATTARKPATAKAAARQKPISATSGKMALGASTPSAPRPAKSLATQPSR